MSQPSRRAARLRATALWGGFAALLAAPLIAAAFSPLLAWRDPIYILAGFAGIAALALMAAQPVLAANLLPGLARFQGRRLHRPLGTALVAAILLHVAGLWVTSPPDVIDVLLFRSPTPFAAWGAIAMWAAFAAATLAAMRRRLRRVAWQRGHSLCVTLAVGCTIVHTLLIQGTMEPITKVLLCAIAALTLGAALLRLRPWSAQTHPGA